MKQKNHSGLKKRIRVKSSGAVMVQKSCKNHLLSNKSKRQKKSAMGGMLVDSTRLQSIRRLVPSAGKVRKTAVVTSKVVESDVVKK